MQLPQKRINKQNDLIIESLLHQLLSGGFNKLDASYKNNPNKNIAP